MFHFIKINFVFSTKFDIIFLMTKRISKILISLMMVAMGLALLLIFFTFSKEEKIISKELVLKVNNLSMTVGETVNDFYEISSQKATVSFEIENPTIISIDGRNLSAIQPGKTMVDVLASSDNQYAHASFIVEVSSVSYKIEIKPVLNCYLFENILYQTENTCQFSVAIKDYKDNLIQNYNYFTTGQFLTKDVAYFILQNNNDCELIFYSDKLGFCIVIDVKRI